jgi:hypothetical protein
VLEPDGKQLASEPVTGGCQLLVAADIDGDGKAEILVGWGQTREHMTTKAHVSLHHYAAGKLTDEVIIAPETARNDITSIIPMPDVKSVLVGYFDSKYMVTSTVLKKTGATWQSTKVGQFRTATQYARGDFDGDGTPDIAVGRVYGDAVGIDGDAFVLRPDGSKVPIPTMRGVRSMAVADIDGDGHPDLFIGDGWHQSYAAHGHGRVTWIQHAADGYHQGVIEDTPGQYSIEKIVPAKIGNRTVLITLGPAYVRAFMYDGTAWKGLTISGQAKDIAVGNLDGKPGDEILVLGDANEIIDLSGVGGMGAK